MSVLYAVTVDGHLPRAVADTVAGRFGGFTLRRVGSTTVLQVCCPDQPSLRSLLNLLFDVGHEVLMVRRTTA